MRKVMRQDRAPRVDSRLVGTVTGPDGETMSAVVLDISREGCRLSVDGELHLGNRIAIDVDRYGSHIAEVRWSAGGEVGAVFVEPVLLP